MPEKYDAVVIGAGPGGYIAASRLGGNKKRTAVVEYQHMGGTCLNWGCIPTKTLLHSSQMVANLNHAEHHGIKVDSWKVDLATMIARKDEVVKKLRGGVEGLMKRKKVDTYYGKGKILGKNKVEVALTDGGTEILETDNIIIATGSEPTVPGVFPQDRTKVMTSDEILDLTKLPKSLTIVGGGVIGCEFATIFSELGTKVTIVEMADRILPMTDQDVSKTLTKVLKNNGAEIHTDNGVAKMSLTKKGVKTKLQSGDEFETDLALICTGRRPYTDNLGLDKVGVQVRNGFIAIDDQCRTNVSNIYAIGDVTGKLQLAHVAYRQAAVAVNTIVGKPDAEDYSVVPSAVYTHPEIAWVGMTEEEAVLQGIKVKKSSFPMSASGLALAYGQTDGLVKILANEHDEIIGAHLMCPHASDAIQEIAVLMKSECTLFELEATIHGHPTFAESIADATGALLGDGAH